MKLAMQSDNQADCSLFPSSFFYSFKDAELWLSLSFFPATETSTHVRYDLFDCAPKLTTDENVLARAIERPVQNLVRNLESEFRLVDGDLTDLSPNSREILDCVQKHERLERAQGSPILPAMHRPKGSSLFQQAEQRKSILILLEQGNTDLFLMQSARSWTVRGLDRMQMGMVLRPEG